MIDCGLDIMIKLPFKRELVNEPIFKPEYLEHLMIRNGFKTVFKLDLGLGHIEG